MLTQPGTVVDSTGAATGVDFSVTGNVAGLDMNFIPNLNPLTQVAQSLGLAPALEHSRTPAKPTGRAFKSLKFLSLNHAH